MGSKLSNQEGNVYGHLLVRLDLGNKVGEKRQVLAECLKCGSGVKSYNLGKIRSGHTTSCGCVQKERAKEVNTRHGMHGTRQYRVWSNLITRCTNPNNEFWNDYGGRSITVCEKWLTFKGFWEDMKEGYSDELEIDRINVDGNYCKENCRWTTRGQNSYNTRQQRNNTSGKSGVYFEKNISKWSVKIQIDGKLKTLGYFEVFEEAVKAREKAEIEIYGYNKP